jgi:hypothetical protein
MATYSTANSRRLMSKKGRGKQKRAKRTRVKRTRVKRTRAKRVRGGSGSSSRSRPINNNPSSGSGGGSGSGSGGVARPQGRAGGVGDNRSGLQVFLAKMSWLACYAEAHRMNPESEFMMNFIRRYKRDCDEYRRFENDNPLTAYYFADLVLNRLNITSDERGVYMRDLEAFVRNLIVHLGI